MFLIVLKRDKICFGEHFRQFLLLSSVSCGFGSLGGAFLVVIFPMKSGGHSGGTFFLGGGGHFGASPPDLGAPPDINTMERGSFCLLPDKIDKQS